MFDQQHLELKAVCFLSPELRDDVDDKELVFSTGYKSFPTVHPLDSPTKCFLMKTFPPSRPLFHYAARPTM
jgi:hypothetical protein